MRLIQRLAAGMCETRALVLRSQKAVVGHDARGLPWKKVPTRVKHLLLRASRLDAKLDVVKAEIERAGFVSGYNFKEVRSQGTINFKDAHDRERKAQQGLEKRIEAIQKRKQQALRDTLGMTELDGKKYLSRLEDELAGL